MDTKFTLNKGKSMLYKDNHKQENTRVERITGRFDNSWNLEKGKEFY